MRLAPITGLFGANSSGKSSILQFLILLKQTVSSPDRAVVLNLGGGERDYIDFGTFSDIAHQSAESTTDASLKWSLSWSLPFLLPIRLKPDNGDERASFYVTDMGFSAEVHEYMSNPIYRKNQAISSLFLQVDHFTYEFRKDELTKYVVGMKRQDSNEYMIQFPANDTSGEIKSYPTSAKPIKCYGFPYHYSQYIREINYDLLPWFGQVFGDQFDRIYYLGPLRAAPKREYIWRGSSPSGVGSIGEATVEAILASRSREYLEVLPENSNFSVEERIAFWLQKLELIHAFAIEEVIPDSRRYAVQVQHTPDSPKVSLADVGFGVSQVLPVLTLCYYVPEGSTIIFEQPEIHLHPRIQAGLADVFIEVAQERNVQILLESHSEHLLARLQRRMAENGVRREGIPSDKVALYFCEREDTEARLKPLVLDEYGYISNWPKDFFGDEMGERVAMVDATIERQHKLEVE